MSVPASSASNRDGARFVSYSRHEWAARSSTTLDAGFDAAVEHAEAREVYVPLAELVRDRLLGARRSTVPVIGIAGSVAVGKSTTARALSAVLGAVAGGKRTIVVSADGFLYPNHELSARGLIDHKGFPETYDRAAFVRFVEQARAGADPLHVPVYSHERYDVLDDRLTVDCPDVLVVEGLHVLGDGARELIEFGVYVDADEVDIVRWYVARFFTLRDEANADPASFFREFVGLSDDELSRLACTVWKSINRVNLYDYILPTRERADVVLEKAANHSVQRVRCRTAPEDTAR